MLRQIIIVCVLQLSLAHNYIPYQAHGFNDLDYFTQLLIKGVNNLKLDLSPQVKNQCQDQSKWNEADNDCEQFENGFNICCLAFRGDTSSTPIFRQPFNISSDLIDLLRNPQYHHILKKGAKHPYDHRIKIAINFQYSDAMANITKRFLYSLMKTIEQFDLDIDFMTGSDNFIFAYMEKCYLQQCDDIERYIAESPIYLQSNSYNPEKKFGEQRYRNFNSFYKTIDQFCINGFPEWITDFDYAMIFWEPSHEYQIQHTREKWESTSCNISHELREKTQIRLSSNLEPEMMQVYWKKPVFEITPSFDPEDQKVILFGDYFDSAIDHSEYCNFLILALNEQPKTINSANLGGLLKIYNGNFELVQQIQINFHIKFARSQQDLLLVQGQNEAVLLTFEKINGGQCKIKSQELFSMKNYEILALSQNSNEIVYFDIVDQILKFSFFDISTKKMNGEINFQMEPIMKTPTQDLSFDAYYSKATNTYHIAITFTKLQLLGEQNYELTNQVKIYLSLLEVSSTYKIIDILFPIHHVDFGTTNDVKFFEYNNNMYLLAIHSNGLCQSAILLNNNDWNKCIYEDYPQYEAISNVPYMINYFWGKLDHIKERVSSGKKINGCDLEIMHAKISNGRDPAITLRIKGDMIQAFVVADFIPYVKQGPLTQLFCGSSNDIGEHNSTGAMLFSFDLVHPQELELL